MIFLAGIPADPRDRSPSPEPIYNNEGVRINTRWHLLNLSIIGALYIITLCNSFEAFCKVCISAGVFKTICIRHFQNIASSLTFNVLSGKSNLKWNRLCRAYKWQMLHQLHDMWQHSIVCCKEALYLQKCTMKLYSIRTKLNTSK